MKKFKNLAIFTAAIILGLIAGFALRRTAATSSAISPTEPTDLVAGTNRTASIATRNSNSRGARTDDSPLARELARDLSMSEGVTRWLYWLDAIEKAQLSDFPRLAELAEGNSIAVQLLAARWIELNPRHLFDTLANDPRSGEVWASLGNTLFKEWPRHDIPAVIAALSQTNSSLTIGRFRHWRINVANQLIENEANAELGVKLLHAWNIENYGPRMKGVGPWAAKDPRHAAEYARAHPAGYATQLIMEEIGKQWAEINPAEAMNFAASQRDESGTILASSALKRWTERDLDGAAKWLASTDSGVRNRYSAPFVEAWAKKDPESALGWCEANLTGSTLAQAVGGLMKGAAAQDVRAAAELVNSLNPSAARSEGALAVAQKWMPEYSSRDPLPPEMVDWLAQLDPQSRRRALDEVQWRWAENDPKGLAAFLSRLNPGEVPERSYTAVGRTYARSDPRGAIDWANSLPEPAALPTGREAFTLWHEMQPTTASEWLAQMDRTDKRYKSFFDSLLFNIAHSPHGEENLHRLSTDQRTAARPLIEKMPLSPERREKLLATLNAIQN